MKPVKPDLLVQSQELKISNTPGVEPEAQVATREYRTDVSVGPGTPQAGMSTQGRIPAVIQYTETAGNIANAVRTCCFACKHWDQKAWLQYVAQSEGPLGTAESKANIAAIRARIEKAGFGETNDPGWVDKSMRSFGICHVLSDWVKGVLKAENPMYWPIVSDRDATCPQKCHAGAGKTLDVTTDAQPMGLFQPRDLDAKKIGAKRYDEVMRDATARKR